MTLGLFMTLYVHNSQKPVSKEFQLTLLIISLTQM